MFINMFNAMCRETSDDDEILNVFYDPQVDIKMSLLAPFTVNFLLIIFYLISAETDYNITRFYSFRSLKQNLNMI